MKTRIICMGLCLAAGGTFAIEPGQPDPRVRSFVAPTRVVWTSGQTGYNKQSSVVNAESLLKPRYGQIPEVQWGRQVGCEIGRASCRERVLW